MCKRIVGLDPIVFEDSRILIVGSMPSAISLKEQMYYANKNNRFWKILESIYQENDKIELLKVSHIALWDICHSCIRKRVRIVRSKILSQMIYRDCWIDIRVLRR